MNWFLYISSLPAWAHEALFSASIMSRVNYSLLHLVPMNPSSSVLERLAFMITCLNWFIYLTLDWLGLMSPVPLELLQPLWLIHLDSSPLYWHLTRWSLWPTPIPNQTLPYPNNSNKNFYIGTRYYPPLSLLPRILVPGSWLRSQNGPVLRLTASALGTKWPFLSKLSSW
jgi:hypothetical protein